MAKIENLYKPQLAEIKNIEELSATVKLFRLRPEKKLKKTNDGLYFIPGQFVMVGEIGYGESTFGIASSPYQYDIKICVRKVGNVTGELHRRKIGDKITLRGPYGNGFPIQKMNKKSVIMAAGGGGIPPIVSLVEYVIHNRKNFTEAHLLYGSATPNDLLFKKEYPRWQKEEIELCLTIDKPSGNWRGEIGFVSGLCKKIEIDPRRAVVAICGPGPMMKSIEETIHPLGIADENIYVSDERRLKCGIGKCQHCTCGNKYICMDGPVFPYSEIKENWD